LATKRGEKTTKKVYRDSRGRFLKKEEIAKIQAAEKRVEIAKKGWETRRAKEALRRRGVKPKNIQSRLSKLTQTEREKLASITVERQRKKKEAPKPKRKRVTIAPAPPTPVKRESPKKEQPKAKTPSRWYLRASTPAAKALESRKAREELERAGYAKEEARELVKTLTRKAKKELIRKGDIEFAPRPPKPAKKKAPKPKISQEESKELAKEINRLKRAIKQATTKRERSKLEKQLEKIAPKRLTPQQSKEEQKRRKKVELIATELQQSGLNIPGVPQPKKKLTFQELTNAEVVEERSIRYLEKLSRDFKDTTIRSALNPDGTIDAELIVNIPRGMSAKQVSTRLASRSSGPPSNTWLAGGIMFQLRDLEESEQWRYQQYLGMSMIASYPVDMRKSKPANVFAAMNQFSENQADSGKLKPSKVVVRLHNGKKQPRYYYGDIEQ